MIVAGLNLCEERATRADALPAHRPVPTGQGLTDCKILLERRCSRAVSCVNDVRDLADLRTKPVQLTTGSAETSSNPAQKQYDASHLSVATVTLSSDHEKTSICTGVAHMQSIHTQLAAEVKATVGNPSPVSDCEASVSSLSTASTTDQKTEVQINLAASTSTRKLHYKRASPASFPLPKNRVGMFNGEFQADLSRIPTKLNRLVAKPKRKQDATRRASNQHGGSEIPVGRYVPRSIDVFVEAPLPAGDCNCEFDRLVEKSIPIFRFISAADNTQKLNDLVAGILRTVRENRGRFVAQRDGRWVEVGVEDAAKFTASALKRAASRVKSEDSPLLLRAQLGQMQMQHMFLAQSRARFLATLHLQQMQLSALSGTSAPWFPPRIMSSAPNPPVPHDMLSTLAEVACTQSIAPDNSKPAVDVNKELNGPQMREHSTDEKETVLKLKFKRPKHR